MVESIRVLILEDNPADAELVQFELEEAGFAFISKVVMTEEDFVHEIQEYCPDLILSDYDLPKYSGALALAEVRRSCPDTPFILVTGAVSEDRAIEILTQGAKDYVLKNRLQQRLVPAIRRALAEADERRARKQAEAELKEAYKTLEEKVKIRTADLEFEMAVRKRTEQVLLGSEEQLKKLYQESPIPTLTWQRRGDDFILVDFNRAAIQLTEDRVGKYFGISAAELYKDRPQILSDINRCYREQITVRREIISKHFAPDRFLAVHYGFIPPDLIIVHMDDQTERKHAEEALRKTLKRATWLARFPEENPNPVIRASAEGIALYCNPSSIKDLAWACRVGDPLPGPVRTLATQAMTSREELHREVQLGALIYAVTLVPFPEESYINIYGRQITKRKQAEELLRKSEERLRLAQEIAHLGSWELDLINNRLTWSDEVYRIFGLQPQEFTATYEAFLERVHPLDREAVDAAYSGSIRESRDTYEVEHRVIRMHTGEIRFVHERCQHFREAPGKIIRSFGMVQDITERKQAEEALKDSEGRYRLLAETMLQGVIHQDANGEIIAMNPAAECILGKSREQFMGNSSDQEEHHSIHENGEPFSDMEHPSIMALRTGLPVRNIIMGVFNPILGDYRWISIDAVPIFHLGETCPSAVYTVFEDITERKQVEKVQTFLAQTSSSPADEPFFNALARYLAESLSMDFVCIDRLEEEGLTARTVAVWCDGHFEDNVTYTLKDTPCGEVVGKMVCCFPASVCQFFPRDQVLQDLRAESYVGVTLFGHTGQPIGLIAAIGRRPLANRTLAEAILKLVVSRAAGEMERLDAERALQDSEKRYWSLFTNMTEGFALHEIIIDTDGQPCDYRFIVVNPAFERMTGLKCTDLTGKSILEVLPQTEAYWIENYGRVALTGEPTHFESFSAALDRWYEVFAYRPVPRQFAVIFMDITERKQAETALKEQAQQLEDANKDLESFNFSIAHDLRAPLRAIAGYSRMILKKGGERFDEETRRRFQMITDNAETMGRLIDDLLVFSRLGSQDVTKRSLDMEELIQEVWQELVTIYPDREMTLKIGQMPTACGDRTLVRQVYSNLLGNAVKFTQGRDVAVIEAGSCIRGDETIYYVRDNGVGFDMKFYDKLFGVFQRLHSEEEFKGTGIGLALVKRIVTRHGGRVWAEGQMDKGAIFYFTLPNRKA